MSAIQSKTAVSPATLKRSIIMTAQSMGILSGAESLYLLKAIAQDSAFQIPEALLKLPVAAPKPAAKKAGKRKSKKAAEPEIVPRAVLIPASQVRAANIGQLSCNDCGQPFWTATQKQSHFCSGKPAVINVRSLEQELRAAWLTGSTPPVVAAPIYRRPDRVTLHNGRPVRKAVYSVKFRDAGTKQNFSNKEQSDALAGTRTLAETWAAEREARKQVPTLGTLSSVKKARPDDTPKTRDAASVVNSGVELSDSGKWVSAN
jgi:hypothetical protein